MTGTATSFAFLLATARGLLAEITGRDGLTGRPADLRPAAAGRLAAGVRVLASFVRRLLVLMALAMEHGLTDRVTGLLARPHGRKSAPCARFKVLDAPFVLSASVLFDDEARPEETFSWADRQKPVRRIATPPSAEKLYHLLDLLAAIVADPEPRARRLAYNLARRRDGPILPPAGPARLAGRWGTEVRASHEAMAGAILSASRARPPPLPPPRRAPPTVICF